MKPKLALPASPLNSWLPRSKRQWTRPYRQVVTIPPRVKSKKVEMLETMTVTTLPCEPAG
jgi:hypothetical protein